MKAEITSQEIGDLLFNFFLNDEKDKTLDQPILEIVPKENKDRVDWELVYLTIAAIDFGVYAALGNNLREKEILDCFYAHIESIAAEKNMPNKFFMQDLKNRQLAYSDAIKQYSPEKYNNRTLLEIIGEKFTEFSGASSDDRIIGLVAIRFGAIFNAIKDLVKAL